MAENTLVENVTQAIVDLKGIREGIESLGWNLEGVKTNQYSKIAKLIPSTVLHEGMTEIADYTFNASSVINGSSAISYNILYRYLTYISLPNTITNIGTAAFSGCRELVSISIPENLTNIGAYTFQNCTKLALTSLSNSVTSIGESAFHNCYELSLTSLPKGLTSIGYLAFFNCKKLALTSLPEGITSIESDTFKGCTNLSSMSLPKSLTNIGGTAFRNCTNLSSITFNSTPTFHTSGINNVWDYYQFDGCTNLKDIYVPWSEGEVEGAPWGAANATIHYNHTSES